MPEKEEFHHSLSLEDITHADFTHRKLVCKGSEIKHLGEDNVLYHLYV